MNSLGGRSEWSGKVGLRVLPPNVTLTDDPGAKDFKGSLLIGGYAIDEEGVPAQKVGIVEEGKLKQRTSRSLTAMAAAPFWPTRSR